MWTARLPTITVDIPVPCLGMGEGIRSHVWGGGTVCLEGHTLLSDLSNDLDTLHPEQNEDTCENVTFPQHFQVADFIGPVTF